ncbi:pyrroloquinoline quinone biosynthesis protein PqqB [Saccharothrix sp. ALI-22-I]|uniref:pyrroloquinoline quinone biosynthesis protein PqqB n=1 Tax=Saccharothrix sp. ALI-22-I TaxID=1933778 RepID=UPI00097C7F3D|nr:pyrroloquinoline quinone biosynthesis protein PqqB [Saccharothrix sp. ALI-22-I]ONI86191.1 pyrroloquinoline quinone biosynthesis protein PqqB [Saccharothrix sp. ALI-22-I]
MKAVVLGTAAGGGVPQWNCACGPCAAVRAGELPARTQDALAVSGDGVGWWLVNTSPDIGVQLASTFALAPGPGPRDTPVRGVLFTDAELDHTLGLAVLRGAAGLRVHAPAPVLHALAPTRDVLATYGEWSWRQVEPEQTITLDGGLEVTAFPVSGKRPRYAADSSLAGHWVVAYRFADPATGGVLLYAPCLASWPPGFDTLVAEADVVLLDGTFYAPSEMGAATGNPSGQAAMGHLPMTHSLPELRRHPTTRRIYTHLNNTNPALNPTSPEHTEITEAGAELVPDGTLLTL